MQTRRDQLHAYRFVTRRIVSALLTGEPETAERPMRRYGLAVFGSAMLATVIFAGVGVYGFISPGGARLKDQEIVIERETGARYVFRDGRLYPVPNFASARLALGAGAPVRRVSERSLRDIPRGIAIGIPNLPDPLPSRSAFTTGPMTACSLHRTPDSTDLVTNFFIGPIEPAGQPLGGNALLVNRLTASTTGTPSRWLLMDGHRFRIRDREIASLGLTAAQPVGVWYSILDGILPGPEIAVPTISGRNEDGPRVAGETRKIGQLFQAAGQDYILLSTGLATVGPVMRALLVAGGAEPIEIPGNAVTPARSVTTPSFDPDGFPTAMPELIFRDTEPAMVCVSGGTPEAPKPTIFVHDRRPQIETQAVAPVRTGPDGTRIADRVIIPGGRASLVRTEPSPEDSTPNTTTYLITDQGYKHALPRAGAGEVLESLGYAGLEPTPVPVFLLALLPLGPTLDPNQVWSQLDVNIEPAAPAGG